MNFPSLHRLGLAFKIVLLRFPLEIAFALTGTIAACVLIELSDLQFQAENICLRLLMVGNLGLVLSLSSTLFSERRGYRTSKKYLLRVLSVMFAAGLFFLLDPLNQQVDVLRYFLLALAFHLLVSFAAFTGSDNIEAFWHFNKTIFLRFLTGALYSAVLFAGLAAALGSMNLLFNFKFEWDTFAILWVWIAGIFQTVFFLSGIPENVNSPEGDRTYPKGLKIFTQFVLIPLASVYVAILLAYEIKILIEWELPKGLVSTLILGYSVFGILSLLLVYPIRNHQENRWIKSYSRNFYFLLIPLIFLLIWAVTARVIDYGITEERYFLIVIAIWLAFISAYFLFSKRHDIRMIPISLCLVTILTIYGPQSAFAVSKMSQLRELQEIFIKYKAFNKSGLQPLSNPVDSADRERIVNVFNYLVDKHGLASLDPILTADIENIEKSFRVKLKPGSSFQGNTRYQIRQEVKDSLLISLNVPAGPHDIVYGASRKGPVRFHLQNKDVVSIAGYKTMITINSNRSPERSLKTTFNIDDKVFQVGEDSGGLLIINQGNYSLTLDMKQHFSKLLVNEKMFSKNEDGSFFIVPDKQMIIEKDLGANHIRFVLFQIEGGSSERAKGQDVLYYNGALLVK